MSTGDLIDSVIALLWRHIAADALAYELAKLVGAATVPSERDAHNARASFFLAITAGLSTVQAVEAALWELEDSPGRDPIWAQLATIIAKDEPWPPLVMMHLRRPWPAQ